MFKKFKKINFYHVFFLAVIIIALSNVGLTYARITNPSGGGGGGSQTPWISNIDGGGYDLNNIDSLGVGTSTPKETVTIQGTSGKDIMNIASSTGDSILKIEQNGELKIVQNSAENAISIDQNGNVGTSAYTDGAIHIENTGNTGIGLGIFSSIGSSADAPLMLLKVASGFDKQVIRIEDSGSSASFQVIKDGTGSNFSIERNVSNGFSAMFIASQQNGSDPQDVFQLNGAGSGASVKIRNTGRGKAINIDHDDTSSSEPSFFLDRDGDDSGAVTGMTIDVANAGSGADIGAKFISDATSTIYIYSSGSFPGRIILEDTDGAGCTEITTLDGTINGNTITCP